MNTPVLQAQQLTRRFGGLTAVAGVDLSLALHEIHAVIGTNGAGKSTLINMLSCELPPTSGRLFLKGEEVTGWSQPRNRQPTGRAVSRLGSKRNRSSRCHLPIRGEPTSLWRRSRL